MGKVLSTQYFAKLRSVVQAELSGLHVRLFFLRGLLVWLPLYVGARTRVRLMRLFGLDIGQGTVILGSPQMAGFGPDIHRRLHIGKNNVINKGCFFDLGAPITLGDEVGIGHDVLMITTSHKIGPAWRRFGENQSAPITIHDGAWVGARTTILPGVTIGAGAVVAAGAVVSRDVLPNTLVGGVPARPIRELDPS